MNRLISEKNDPLAVASYPGGLMVQHHKDVDLYYIKLLQEHKFLLPKSGAPGMNRTYDPLLRKLQAQKLKQVYHENMICPIFGKQGDLCIFRRLHVLFSRK
ncbi:hypothetical protein NO1_0964 [Candidatus Termititenax aidoneus]|uniref:Uncharacterized protein n=1 Tax=Termititenax aidoneus TaxID=2218524 RepID=A0A388TB90_TERA1|nr:hypothetical protein NO1_0964 [Candidatus Termititenax aidoneus]